MNDDIFSREIKAGWNPEINSRLKVLAVGTGALGQSCYLSLALAQVGEIRLVDCGQWDLSNASRSPMFGTAAERNRFGNWKAACVAHRLAEHTSWSNKPQLSYATTRIQELGDAVFRDVDIVVCCVDDNASRSDIAIMCQRHGLPMIEGGFREFSMSYGVYGPETSDPCWLCGTPNVERALIPAGCDAKEKQLKLEGFIGATQTVAALTGTLMADAVIQIAHEQTGLVSRRVYFPDIRNPSSSFLEKQVLSPTCNAPHQRWPENIHPLQTDAESTVGDLLSEVAKFVPDPLISLRAPFVLHENCIRCEQRVKVGQPEWSLSRHPVCEKCDPQGFPQATGAENELYGLIGFHNRNLLDWPCWALGLVAGEVITIRGNANQQELAMFPAGPNPFTDIERPIPSTMEQTIA